MRSFVESMNAFRLVGWQRPPEFQEVPVPVPRGEEVLVEVAAVGLCHSDVHFLHAPEGAFPYPVPFTLGHEIAGKVVAVGSSLAGFPLETAVARRARTALLELSRVPARRRQFVHKTHERARVGPGRRARALCLRPGARGHPARIPRPGARGTARRCGRDCLSRRTTRRSQDPRLVDGGGDRGRRARGLRGPAATSADLVSHPRDRLVGDEAGTCPGARSGRRPQPCGSKPGGAPRADGRLRGRSRARLRRHRRDDDAGAGERARRRSHRDRGAGGGTASIGWGLLPNNCDLFIPQGGTTADLHDVIALANAGRLRIDIERFPFERTAEAYAQVEAGSVAGRAVVVMR